jgi:hypothetical protein
VTIVLGPVPEGELDLTYPAEANTRLIWMAS